MMVFIKRFGIISLRGIREDEDELEVVQQELGVVFIRKPSLFKVVDEKKFMLGVIKYGTLYHRVTTIDK